MRSLKHIKLFENFRVEEGFEPQPYEVAKLDSKGNRIHGETIGIVDMRDNGTDADIEFADGKTITFEYGEDWNETLDYHTSGGNEGLLKYVAADGSFAIIRAYSPTGNPDQPDWELEDVDSVYLAGESGSEISGEDNA
jgi:hypothetical protein